MPLQSACFRRKVSDASFNPTRIPPFIPAQFEFSPASEDTDKRSIYVDTPSAQDNRYWGWYATIDWDAPAIPLLGETSFKLLGGFQKTENVFNQDFDATDNAILSFELDSYADQYTTELQWSGSLAERLDWQTSLFYAHEKAARDIFVPPFDASRPLVTNDQSTDNKSYGAALHGTYHLAESLRFSLGGRFIKDRKRTLMLRSENPPVLPERQFRGCTGDLGNIQQLVPARPNEDCSLIDRHTMWGAGIDWRPDFGPFQGNHLFYAKIDRGAKSGGFRAGTVGEYLPEKIWAYAVGSKSNIFDDRLQVNIEGFFYAYEDMQLVILDGLSLRTENADTRMHGVDLEAAATPIPGLYLSAVVSFLKTETLDYYSLDTAAADSSFQRLRLEERENAESIAETEPDTLPFAERGRCIPSETDSTPTRCGNLGDKDGLDDFSGNDLSRSPEWKITLSGEYEISLGDWGTLTPRVQYTWQDDTYFRAFNTEVDLQEDFHQTDVKLIWRSPEQRWEVEAFVQNIEDEAPKSNILVGPRELGSAPLAWYGPPRFFGVRVGFTY
jgi:iron complex outermembrane receptor protein